MAEKHKNIFLKFCNVALCATKNRSAEIWPKTKNIFEILQHSILSFSPADEIWPKNIKIFLILQHSIVRHLKICIRVYSEFSIFTSRRNEQKTKKNFFNLMHTGLIRAFYFHQQTK
ncbi:hypothetical protein PUN28_020324 [Cardiocondyla obscurior]|uniref:Uncharacterized protein n=1 Tax=Cardiocondyla obscurior TaxID=286306 RepID=A0AAW2E7K7_9HYME